MRQAGLEPATFAMRGRRSRRLIHAADQWGRTELNRQQPRWAPGLRPGGLANAQLPRDAHRRPRRSRSGRRRTRTPDRKVPPVFETGAAPAGDFTFRQLCIPLPAPHYELFTFHFALFTSHFPLCTRCSTLLKDRDRTRTCMHLSCNQAPDHFGHPAVTALPQRADRRIALTGPAGVEPAHCGFRIRRAGFAQCGRQESNLYFRRGGAAL